MDPTRPIRAGAALALMGSLIFAPAAAAIRPAETDLEDSLSESQYEALATLALADGPLRDAILDASLHPGLIERIAQIREDSSRRFRRRVQDEARATQKDVWELARYPELVDELVFDGRPSSRQLDEIAAPYPDAIRDAAQRLARDDFELLVDVAAIRADAERETAAALAPLPIETQASFEGLIERPDLLTAMVEEPAVVERLARLQRADARRAREVFDREHEKQVAANQREVAAWREAIEDDPEARDELVESAEAFAQEEDYASPRETAGNVTEIHVYHHPYPWWFGPPIWRVGCAWYPYHSLWGFEITLAGGLAIYSLPSPVFSIWYERRPYHHRDRHLYTHWSHYVGHARPVRHAGPRRYHHAPRPSHATTSRTRFAPHTTRVRTRNEVLRHVDSRFEGRSTAKRSSERTASRERRKVRVASRAAPTVPHVEKRQSSGVEPRARQTHSRPTRRSFSRSETRSATRRDTRIARADRAPSRTAAISGERVTSRSHGSRAIRSPERDATSSQKRTAKPHSRGGTHAKARTARKTGSRPR